MPRTSSRRPISGHEERAAARATNGSPRGTASALDVVSVRTQVHAGEQRDKAGGGRHRADARSHVSFRSPVSMTGSRASADVYRRPVVHRNTGPSNTRLHRSILCDTYIECTTACSTTEVTPATVAGHRRNRARVAWHFGCRFRTPPQRGSRSCCDVGFPGASAGDVEHAAGLAPGCTTADGHTTRPAIRAGRRPTRSVIRPSVSMAGINAAT